MKIDNKTLTVLWIAFILLGMIFLFCAVEEENAAANDEFVEPVDDKIVYSLPELPWYEMGYTDFKQYWLDIQAKRAEAKGAADEAIEKYSSVITDEQEQQLRDSEKKMLNAVYLADYEKAAAEFDAVTAECQANMPVYRGSGSSGHYVGGGFDIPYNFRQMGVLHDDDYRYTYYSSQVLYHYMTPQWTLGSDGIYRDGNGRVVVASDDYKHGTVVQSDLFGECVVLDCGVGSSGTLDVYVGW